MEQLEFFEVPSPCIGVCAADEKGYCKGCMRKREERFQWMSLTSAEKLRVIKLCRMRYRRRMTKNQHLNGLNEQDDGHPQQSLF